MSVSSTLMPVLSENCSCMRVDESWEASLYESFPNTYVVVKR